MRGRNSRLRKSRSKSKNASQEWGFISVVDDVLTDGKAPATFIFQTREGSQGLLQIIGPAEKNGVKIRYKVTKEAEDASATAMKPALPADPLRDADRRMLVKQYEKTLDEQLEAQKEAALALDHGGSPEQRLAHDDALRAKIALLEKRVSNCAHKSNR